MHVNRGGSLNEVPNEFWPDAMQANASNLPNDTTRMFHVSTPNEGMIGTLRIYHLRDADGNPTGQGWVVKASTATRYNGKVIDDTWSEVAGWNLAAAAGISPQGAMYGGLDGSGRQRVIIPLGSNIGPDGKKLSRGNQAYDRAKAANAPNMGYPARMNHFLHNYFLAVADRNPGNGLTYSDQDGQFYVMPADLARTGFASQATLETYASKFSMDRQILSDMRTLIARSTPEQRDEIRAQALESYDAMVSRYRAVIRGGKDAFIARMTIGSDSSDPRQVAMREERLGVVYDTLKRRLTAASAQRKYLRTNILGMPESGSDS
jgi:hypothetical protein